MNPRTLTGTAATVAKVAEKFLGLFGLSMVHPRNLAQRLLNRTMAKATVLAGPFAGMKYVSSSVGSQLLPKVLGTYELELQPIVETFCRHPLPLVVDVGAAEGYYAVGLAWRCPGVRCIAFEAEAEGRALLQELARLNGAEQKISIHGFCTPDALASALTVPGETLLIVDVEGAEKELLDPVRLPSLRECHILVELHPQFHPDIAQEISTRFASTHKLQLIHEQERMVHELPFGFIMRRLFGRWLILATSEYRPLRMAWLWMQPNHADLPPPR